MSVFQVGSKVHVTGLNWNKAEIVEIRPFWKSGSTDGIEPDGLSYKRQCLVYVVRNTDNDHTQFCTSDELILVP